MNNVLSLQQFNLQMKLFKTDTSSDKTCADMKEYLLSEYLKFKVSSWVDSSSRNVGYVLAASQIAPSSAPSGWTEVQKILE